MSNGKMPFAKKRKASYRSRPYAKKRKVTRRPRRTNLKRMMRKTMMTMVETKKKEYSYGKIEMYHNADPVWMSLNNEPQNPDDGDGSTQRIGDEIYQRGFKVKMMLYNKGDRPNLTWKVRVVSVQRASGFPEGSSSGTISYATFFRQVSGNNLLDDVENGRFKTVASYTFKNPQIQANVTAGAANANECVTTRQFYVKAPQKITYTNDDEFARTGRHYVLVVTAYDAYGSLTTDNIGAIQCLSTMFYKDP